MADTNDPTLWNPDLAPTGPEQRTWLWYHYAALWVGMIVAVPAWMLAAGLIGEGMSAAQAALTVLLGNIIVLIPMLLIGHAGARHGIPYAVLVRTSFGTIGARLPALARALVRRSQARTSNQIQLARVRIDQEARRAFIDEEPLALSAREWDVLGYLMARAGKVVSKEHIAMASNAWDQGVSDNAIEVCLSRLRAKIEPGGVQLRTVRGLGYLLEEMPQLNG